MQWHFGTKRPSDKTRDPVVGEFFSQDAIKDAGQALVREAIQNSLDARAPENALVRVRVVLSGAEHAVAPEAAARWFDTAWRHYLASGNGLRRDVLSRLAPCRFLVFEDFGTTGLIGDRHQYEEQTGGEGSAVDNPFFYFFRAEAKTAKYGDARGRWGIGKQVFPRSSRAQTFFGYTETDEGGFLMGGCVLKHHQIDGVSYKPDGFWGEVAEVAGDQLTVPTSDGDTIAAFRRDFRLQRTAGDRGLSVVVPYLDDSEGDTGGTSFTRGDLILSILDGYFLPILEGRLEATIEDPTGSLRLTKGTYEELLQGLRREAVDSGDQKRIRELDRLAVYLGMASRILRGDFVSYALPPCSPTKAAWEEAMLPGELAGEMRAKLAEGVTLRVTSSLTVRPKVGEDRIDHFECFLTKEADLVSKPCHIREDLIISGVASSKLSGYACIVRVNAGPLATLLGDSENPAHTEWNASSRNFKDKYVYGGLTIEFVSQFPSEILKRIHATSRELDRSLLLDLFSETGPDQDPDDPQPRGGRRADHPDPRPPLPPPPPAKFRIGEVESGFQLVSTPVALAPGTKFVIRAAYETAKGSAFSSYDPNDFSFAGRDLNLDYSGCELGSREDNRLELVVVDANFRLSVRGFDTNRDLVVRAEMQAPPVPTPIDEGMVTDGD